MSSVVWMRSKSLFNCKRSVKSSARSLRYLRKVCDSGRIKVGEVQQQSVSLNGRDCSNVRHSEQVELSRGRLTHRPFAA